jgi:hypothetical protein
MPEGDTKPNVPPRGSGVPELIPATGFPSEEVLTIFADGVANIAPSQNIMKFYLYRTDPDISGVTRYRNSIPAQIVMPMDGFISTVAFLHTALARLVSQGILSKELVDGIYSQTTENQAK